MPNSLRRLTVLRSEAKRSADAVEGLDRADVKKQKLDTSVESQSGTPQDAGEDAEEELPEEAIDEPAPTAMEVDKPVEAAQAPEPKIRFKKGKTAEGAAAHFKENPYTFIAPEDPIVKACVCVPAFALF